MNMATLRQLREIEYKIGGIHRNNVSSSYPLAPINNNNNMSITLTFVLKQRTRDHQVQVNSDNQITSVLIDTDFPQRMSTKITLVPQNDLSYEDMRKALHDICVTVHEVQDIVIETVDDYLEGLVNDHQPDWGKQGVKVDLFLTIYRVFEYQEVILNTDQDDRPKPADEAVVRKLKRKRVDETMVGEDESCPVCLEMLVEKEELIVLPCEHVFHEACVSKWFKKSHLCPLCRFELPIAQKPKKVIQGDYEVRRLPRLIPGYTRRRRSASI